MDQRKRRFVDIIDSSHDSEGSDDDDDDVHKKDRRSSMDKEAGDDKKDKVQELMMMDFVMAEVHAGNSLQGQSTTTSSTSLGMIDDIQEKEESPLASCTKAMSTLEVIGNIAKYLKPTDMNNLRLTSKTWNKACIPQLRKRHKFIRLHHGNMIKPWWSKNLAGNYFTNYINETKDILFRRYHIDGISFDHVYVGTFFSKCGANLTSLQISVSDHTWLPMSVFRNVIFNATPCLEELILRDNRERLEEGQQQRIPFWEEDVLCNVEFPKELLSTLTLKRLNLILRQVNGENWTRFITDLVDVPCLHDLMVFAKEVVNGNDIDFNSGVMAALEDKKELQNLKILNLNFLRNSQLRSLIDWSERESNRLELSDIRVILPVLPSQEVVHSLEELLKLQSNSLLALDLYFKSDYGVESITNDGIKLVLPQMVNLKTLVINLLINTNEEGLMLDLFLNNFPKLTKLEYRDFANRHLQFDSVTAEEPLQNNLRNQPHTTLQQLYAHGIDHFNTLERLGTLFPCITTLFITMVDLELLCNVWTTPWLQLQTLKVIWYPEGSAEENLLQTSSLVDEYLTGIPHEEHSLILKLINGGYPIVDLSLLKTKPGLTDIKSLRRLELELGLSPTDISAYYSFGYESTNLTYIVIYKADEISKTCRHMVQSKLGPFVNIQYGDG